jgi:hypothetical protein
MASIEASLLPAQEIRPSKNGFDRGAPKRCARAGKRRSVRRDETGDQQPGFDGVNGDTCRRQVVEPAVQRFSCGGIDASMLHQSRREVAGIAGHPRRSEGAIARRHAEAFQVGQRAANAQPQFVCERFELPRLSVIPFPP